MKLNGQTESRMEMVHVIPRPGKVDLVFKLKPVESFKEFDKLVPFPKPPEVMVPGGGKKFLTDDDSYKNSLKAYTDTKGAYISLQTLAATPGLEWDTVTADQPSTWANWLDEVEAFGLSSAEVMRLTNAIMAVNALDDSLIVEARDRYFREQAEQRAREESLVSEVQD